MGAASLPLDGEGAGGSADFECACCGTSFKSNLLKQKAFDQDNGYGFCPECEKSYYR
jgi:hypothetical protein